MTDQELERKLEAAVRRTAPDGLERLLSEVQREKGVRKMEKTKKNRTFRWAGLVAACLALILLGGAGGFWYSRNYSVTTVVSLDVNPSIELKVNRSEKVLECDPLNAEAREVLSSMDGGRDLEGAKLDVAVNAIVGAIVRAGYLDSLDSAILISVDDKDADRGARLQAKLVETVDGVLQNSSNNASVMSQNTTTDAKTAGKAQQYGISTGKAAYIEQVLALNADLDYAKLAQLTVEELRDLIRIGAPAMPIGKDAAAQAAEEYAGVNLLNSYLPQYTKVDPEIDDPTPHYEVEIDYTNYNGREYEYEIDAFTGEVLRGLSGIIGENPGEAAPQGPAITADEAFDAAAEYFSENHPELTGNFLNIENRYDSEDGCFEIEFWCQGWEFDYDVDGETGRVLREETGYRYTPPTQSDPAPVTPAVPDEPTDIGVEAAKTAALRHAGLAQGDVTFIKAKQDYDDGRLVYEVDFYTSGAEYDYEIDAATGEVLKYDSETRPAAQSPSTGDIGEAAAKEAALQRAGVTESVDWLKCEHDYDNGRHYYELEFECGATVYECDVDAATGDVVKFGSEPCDNILHDHASHDDTHHDETHHSGDIGAEAAKAAALRHAGLTESQVTRLKCEKDTDDGRTVYEIEFRSNGCEYEYKIDASTGSVLEHEKDRD